MEYLLMCSGPSNQSYDAVGEDKAFRCSICGGIKFASIGAREKAKCESCGSAERTRFLWLFLQKSGVIRPGMKVLHCAPEKSISTKMQALIGTGYYPADINPERYRTESVEVNYIDLLDLSSIEDGSFDAVIHLHVLEHLPCPLDTIILETMRILSVGGRFIFGLPISSGISFENIWPEPTPEDRLRLFGQHDHVRLVGRDDFPRFLSRVLSPFSDRNDFRVDPQTIIDDAPFELATSITRVRAMGYTGDTLFNVPKVRNPATRVERLV